MPIREELWEFPHAMQLKVLGAADTLPEMKSAVVDILETHLDDFDRHQHLSSKPSTKGNYVALTARVTLRDRDQVEQIYAALNACPHVKITL